MTGKQRNDELDVLRVVRDALDQVDAEARERILRYISDRFDLDVPHGPRRATSEQPIVVNSISDDRRLSFADRATLSPKEFLHEKQPRTDNERVACLAYFLLHYRDAHHFKTIDISKLNTEAAQIKFANPAQAVKNAISHGLLASAGKGARQISAIGERYVDALPDRDAAKAVLASGRPRRRRKSSSTRKAPTISK